MKTALEHRVGGPVSLSLRLCVTYLFKADVVCGMRAYGLLLVNASLFPYSY